MRRINKIISLLVLVSFLFNTALTDLAFSQQVTADKLAISSRFNHLSSVEAANKMKIEAAVQGLLLANSRISIPGVHLYETKTLPNGFLSIMCRVEDPERPKKSKTYYAVFSPQKDADGKLPIHIYTEEDYTKVVPLSRYQEAFQSDRPAPKYNYASRASAAGLTVTRAAGESIIIGENVRVKLIGLMGKVKVRILVTAPESVSVVRGEIFDGWRPREIKDKGRLTNLVIDRKEGETIKLQIGSDEVELRITSIRSNKVRVSVDAPPHIPVDREELRTRKEESQAAGQLDLERESKVEPEGIVKLRKPPVERPERQLKGPPRQSSSGAEPTWKALNLLPPVDFIGTFTYGDHLLVNYVVRKHEDRGTGGFVSSNLPFPYPPSLIDGKLKDYLRRNHGDIEEILRLGAQGLDFGNGLVITRLPRQDGSVYFQIFRKDMEFWQQNVLVDGTIEPRPRRASSSGMQAEATRLADSSKLIAQRENLASQLSRASSSGATDREKQYLSRNLLATIRSVASYAQPESFRRTAKTLKEPVPFDMEYAKFLKILSLQEKRGYTLPLSPSEQKIVDRFYDLASIIIEGQKLRFGEALKGIDDIGALEDVLNKLQNDEKNEKVKKGYYNYFIYPIKSRIAGLRRRNKEEDRASSSPSTSLGTSAEQRRSTSGTEAGKPEDIEARKAALRKQIEVLDEKIDAIYEVKDKAVRADKLLDADRLSAMTNEVLKFADKKRALQQELARLEPRASLSGTKPFERLYVVRDSGIEIQYSVREEGAPEFPYSAGQIATYLLRYLEEFGYDFSAVSSEALSANIIYFGSSPRQEQYVIIIIREPTETGGIEFKIYDQREFIMAAVANALVRGTFEKPMAADIAQPRQSSSGVQAETIGLAQRESQEAAEFRLEQVAAMNEMADGLGKDIWDAAGKYNLIMPSEFYKNGDLANHNIKYASRFNLKTISGSTRDTDKFIESVLANVKEGEEARTVALVPRDGSLKLEHLEKLKSRNIRFVLMNLTELGGIRGLEEKERSRFQEHTYAVMLLFRYIDQDTIQDPRVYSAISFYLKSHFGFTDKVTVDAYIDAILRTEVAQLIKAYLSYKMFMRYDALEEHRTISQSLIFA